MAVESLARTIGLTVRRGAIASNLLLHLKRARAGDEESIWYLRNNGILDLAEAVQPGLSHIIGQMLQHAADAKQNMTGIAEGEYRSIDDADAQPWYPFVHWLQKQTYGGHVLLGPMQSGKTTFGIHLAQTFARRLGYDIEVLKIYKGDKPDNARTIDMAILEKRMKQLQAHLDGDVVDDDGTIRNPDPPPLPDMYKVLVIDEASLVLDRGGSEQARNTIFQALANVGHLKWHIIFIAQWSKQLPEDVLLQTTKYVKKPSGDEMKANDRGDNRLMRELWRNATAHFAILDGSPWRYLEGGAFCDPRAWAYVHCPYINFGGLVPYRHYSLEDAE